MSPSTSPELAAVVRAALDDVQAGLDEPHLEPARRSLADEVQRHLRRRRLDPLTRAMIDRPTILAWAVERALPRTEPGEPALYRRAAPLADAPKATRRRATGKGTGS